MIALVLCLSMLVSMGTFAAFHKTAVAKTYTKDVLDCPYAMEDAEAVAHVHNDDCYDGETLVCTLPEREAHTHDDTCYAESRMLSCGLEENPGHQHSEACFDENGELTCQIPEGEGAHAHTDACYTIERALICNQPELPVHVHDAGCFRTEEITVDEPEETAASEQAVSTVPEMPVSDPNADLETADDWNREFENLELSGNWARDLVLVAATQQGRGESPNNFEAVLNDAGNAWVRHGYTRYGAWYGYPYAEWSAMFVSFCLRYAGIPAENVPNNPTAAFMAESFQKGELFAGRDYVPAVGDLIFFDTVDDDITTIDHMGIVYHVDAENGTINTVEGDRADIVTTFAYHLDDEQIVGYGILPQNPYFVPAEGEVPDEEIGGFIVMTMDEEVTNEEEKTTDADKETADTDEETADTAEATMPAVPMPAQSWERTAGGIKVSVEAPEGAFPENTRIAVTPVNGNSLMDTVSDAVNGEVLEVQAVDITFFNEEGREIEPAAPIRVTMTPAETEYAEEKANVVHVDIAQQTAELIEQAEGTETDNTEVVFDAEAFTIYAIVYTYQVDFEYEVDGKVYTSSMPGAEDMPLAEIVKGLSIVEEAELEIFLSKIASVACTNEEVAIVTENRSVRVLKDGDAQIVITMQDGAKFKIGVSADGETEISDENNVATISTVNDLYLPANSEVKAELLTEEQSGNAVAAVQMATESDGSGAATYQAFSIALENVDVTAYDGFNVAVALPEDAVVGRDFQLYQVREDGTATDLTESLTVTSQKNEEGLQNVSGISFTTEDFADFVLSYSIETYYTTADGDRYKITLNYGSKAEIPDGAELKVREILPEDETYSNYLDDSAAKLGVNSGDVSFARFFDIEIQKDDEKIEPKAPVQVTVSLADTPEETVPEGLKVLHFAQTGLETIDETQAEQKEDATIELSFETDGFSVYGVVYTVDFHYEINGKVYDFSIPGGGFVSLEHIVEALGLGTDTNEHPLAEEAELAVESVAESAEATGSAGVSENGAAYDEAIRLNAVEVSEATREFVADVVNVEFSSPELVWVGKVDESATVGGLKEANGLEVEYSANLTEEQIAEINAQTVEAGDWALISVQPFTSEETLTITMKNGDVFVIEITDGQIHTYVISDSGDTYKITVTYDDATGIPSDAELRARLLTPEDERYQEDIDRSNAALLARYDQEATNPLVFEIKIFADDVEIEPAEGTQVSVEISLAMAMLTGQPQDEDESGEAEATEAPEDEDPAEGEVAEGSMLINGVEYTLEPAEVDLSATKVVHLTDDGEAVIIDDLNCLVDADNNMVTTFETESFSDYMLQGVNNNNGLNGLPDVIYVGDEIYMQNSGDMWVTGIGSVVTETKYDGDNYKSVRATNTGTFRICHRNDWNNGNPYRNYKEITILPARSVGNYEGTTPPATIPTVSNASIGLTLNLFDYDLDDYLDNRFNNKDFGDHLTNFKDHGINNGNALKFWGSGVTDGSYGSHNNYVEHGVTSIVDTSLNASGYPQVISSAGSSGGSGNTDLTYLFAPFDGTDKLAYLNADGLFKKDGDYYVYNSNENYAWYNPGTNKFEVYSGTYKQKSRSKGGEQATELEDKAIGFFPFHKWDDQYDLFVNWDKNLNHHFGMSMSVPFSLPKDPKAVVDTNGYPIIFEFSGDDDLWVFIDGKLAMDIGGIHQPTSGTINFQNQTVTANGQSQTFDFRGLYDGKLHTLQVFYIERGGCDSNCMIKFNLTQYGDVEFDKVDQENHSDKLAGAVFGIYKDEACTQPLMENLKNGTSRAYVAESNTSGHVKFSDIPLGDYYLKEIKAPDGYPLDSTVHPVKVYLDENSLVIVKTSIDGIDVVSPGVQIPNKKPDPITLGLKKEWKDQNGNTIPAPENTQATFELKRIRTYERITEETPVEGHDVQSSHLVVGWYHNGNYHVHKEYDLIAGTQATVSWSYVDGYTGSKDCYENGTRIDKDSVSGLVISEALTLPAAGGEATLYIVDESENGEAIKNINVAGEQFYGTSGGGVIHKFETITEPDPDFQYTGDSNVDNNQITLPLDGDTPWEYDFENLPLVSRTPNTPTTYSYTYYLEELSNISPEGTTVIYTDRAGNVLNAAEDAETNQTGTQTITNQVDLGALELTKNITITNASDQTQPMIGPNPWVNGTVSFTIDGVEETFTEGIHHDVEITYVAGKITGYKIDTTQTSVDPAVTGTTYSILVANLVPGDYVIKETGSGKLTLTEITGGKNDANLTAKTVTVTVTYGKNTAETIKATAKATFTNNLKTIDVPATKTWSDIKPDTTHPTIYFKLFYRTETGDVAVEGVKLKPLPNGTTAVTWENVPKYDQNGQEYDYLVKEYIQKDGGEFTEDGVAYTEAAPNGYVATENGLSVTNTESDKYDPRTSYTGRKVWEDTTNNGATRPDNLTVTLMIDKTGDGPSLDDVVAMNDDTPYTPVWNKPEGTNEWTYTFNSLPVYDADWNIIHYYAVETPVNGYEQDNSATITDTKYVYKNSYNAQKIENDSDVTLDSEIHKLPFVAIKKTNAYGYSEHYHIWTVRTATAEEQTTLINILNAQPGCSDADMRNTRFVSGLPVGNPNNAVGFLYADRNHGAYKIRITKTSGDTLNVGVDNHTAFQYILVGTLEYDYSAGSTDLQNTLKTEDYDAKKTWGDGQTPPEGAEVQFTLTATIPGTATIENPNPDPEVIADLTTLGVTKAVVTLNGGQKEGEEYTGDDTTEAPWVYKWENLPQYDKNGNKITYSASETSYTIDGEPVDITSEGLVPSATSYGTYELIITNRIPTESISAHKYWPEGQTVPEGTHIKLTITAKLEGGDKPNGVTVTPATVTLDGKVTEGDENEVETADTLWQYTWTALPKYDKDGKKIIYSVAETEYKIGNIAYEDLLAAANEPVHEGVDFSFTNELPGTRITVEKTWSNNGAWPDGVSVVMTLKGSAPIGENGEQTELETLVLPDIKEGEETVPQTAEYALSGSETSHTWYNLPMYTSSGKPITYTVDETGMTYTEPGKEPIPITNWAQAFTVHKTEYTENNKVTIDNTPLETEISLTKVWTLNGQPKSMEDGDAIEFKLYRTDAEGELTLSTDAYTANKGTATLNKILYVSGGDNPGWQTVTISKLPKYVLKLETTTEGTIAYYTGVAYYAIETNVTGSPRISYSMSPMNAGGNGGSDSGEGDEDSGNNESAVSNETTNPTQSAIGAGTITIFNRETSVDISILKVDATDSSIKLPTAEFQILKWSEESKKYLAYNLEKNDYSVQGEESKSKLITGADGTLKFEGLLDGKYKVVETKTPAGYIMVGDGGLYFSINDGTVTWTDEMGVIINSNNKPNQIDYNNLTFTVGNTPGTALPNTGGSGTGLFTLIGGILSATAGAILTLTSHRRRKEQYT